MCIRDRERDHERPRDGGCAPEGQAGSERSSHRERSHERKPAPPPPPLPPPPVMPAVVPEEQFWAERGAPADAGAGHVATRVRDFGAVAKAPRPLPVRQGAARERRESSVERDRHLHSRRSRTPPTSPRVAVKSRHDVSPEQEREQRRRPSHTPPAAPPRRPPSSEQVAPEPAATPAAATLRLSLIHISEPTRPY